MEDGATQKPKITYRVFINEQPKNLEPINAPPPEPEIFIHPEVLNPPAITKPGDPGHITARKKMSVKQEKYAQARLAGMSPAQAKNVAGYPPFVSSGKIEGSKAVQQAMDKALKRQGMSLDYLAEHLRGSIDGCDKAKSIMDKEGNIVAHDPDYGSKTKLLTLLAKLLGYDKLDAAPGTGPQNVTQIYNDNRVVEGLANGEVASFVELLREELSRRQSGDIREIGGGGEDTAPHP